MRRSVLLALTVVIASAQELAGQACTGLPLDEGRTAIAAVLYRGEAIGLGADIGTNIAGPLALRAGLLQAVFPNGGGSFRSIAGELASESIRTRSGVMLCPVGALRWTWRSLGEQKKGQVFAMPLGIGIGKVISRPGSPSISPYVAPKYWIARFSDQSDPLQNGMGMNHVYWGSDLVVETGLAVAAQRLFGSGKLVWGYIGPPVEFEVSLGVHF